MTTKGHILLGVCGSIAAYKSAYLTRLLVQDNFEVKVIMTDAASGFVSPLTFSTLSGHAAICDFTIENQSVWNNHVELGLWANLMLIAPASANTIAKMAAGIADNILLTTYLSCKAPVAIAPAMDLDMWQHHTSKRNLDILKADGVHYIAVESGLLASGLEGEGRMAEPEVIFNFIKQKFFAGKKKSLNKKILITGGPTYEPIDPVRFIGNHATGTMAVELAKDLAGRGASINLILGPSTLTLEHENINVVRINTAEQMLAEASKYFPAADIFISAAAVADFTPVETAKNKIKKSGKALNLPLKTTVDILKTLSKNKREGQIIVGFALETENAIENAQKKLQDKNLDLIVLNSLQDKGAGFGYTNNRVTFIDRNNKMTKFELKPKSKVAGDIVNYLIEKFDA